MEIGVTRLIRDEKGRAMMLALIMLVVGGLTLTPLLGLMSTGLLAGQAYEGKTDELYAADAGVEDAVWKIQERVPELPGPACGGEDPNYWSYNMTDDANRLNGKNVEVTITYVNNLTYKIDSIAIGDGSGTIVEAYVAGESVCADYSGIADHIITSQGEYDVKNKVTLVYPEGREPVEYYGGDWPDEPEELALFAQFYWLDVEDETHYGGYTTVDLEGQDLSLGPLYVDGQLEILNSGATGVTVTLNGTIYVTGDTLIGQTNQDFTLDLNGQTIFVETDSAEALIVGGKCTVTGPGAIIAVGDVYFAPKGDVGNNGEPVFILSVLGTTLLQPSGDFYGAIAGSVEVEIKQGATPTVTYPEAGFGEGDLNFPGFTGGKLVYHIATWEINPV
jgi:hypothetical protein